VIDNKQLRKDKIEEVVLDDQLLIAEETTNLVIEKHVHKPGEVVEVLPRTWPGYTYIYTYTYMYIHIYIYTYYIYVTFVYAYIYMRIYMYIHMYCK
jgi:hypothetical protein